MPPLPDHPLAQAALAWIRAQHPSPLPQEQYCGTRDVLDARIAHLRLPLLRRGVPENTMHLLLAVISEIGGNSFDHNLGQWKDLPGVFFSTSLSEHGCIVILADRGQGIRSTLRRVRPNITSDAEALRIAFLERLSGRAPERRGNGLKFVRSALLADGIDLFFQSGSATYTVIEKEERWEEASPITGCLAVLSSLVP